MPKQSSSPASPFGDRPLLTKPEVMRWLRVSRSTVEDHIRSGHYQTLTEGKRVKIVTSSVLAYIERSAKRSAA